MMNNKLIELTEKVDQLESHTGAFPVTFKVDNLSQHPSALRHWSSTQFYSHHNGYKLQIRLWKTYLGWSGSSSGPRITFQPHILQGDYDSKLQWPLRGVIRIEIFGSGKEDIFKHKY